MKKYLLLALGLCFSFISQDLMGQNSLAVTVFEDIDGNGVQDAGELTIAGITTGELRLWEDADGNNTISGGDIEHMHDDGAGVYTFGVGNTLPDGDYFLEYVETGAVGSFHVTKAVGSDLIDNDNDVNPDDNVAAFNLIGDTPEMLIDLGLVVLGDIGSFVWQDVDGDGVQDGGELGIGGVNVTLIDASTSLAVTTDVNLNPITNPVTTDGAGMYSFTDVPPGQYIIEFSEPAPSPDPWYPTMSTPDTDALDPTNDSDAENDPLSPNYLQSHTIILLSGDTDEADKIDAGFFQAASIGDMVWEDVNGDGVQDGGELGIDGMTVRLIDVNTGVQAIGVDGLAIEDITAGGGFYSLDLVAPGDYRVEFDMNIGGVLWYPTEFDATHTDANDPDTDSDANNDPASPDYLRSHVITILSAETDEQTRIDGGFFLPAVIGNMVWEDVDGLGTFDGPDVGIDGVTVSLLDDTGATAIGADGFAVADQVTAGGGFYEFDLVAPGDYQVLFNLPPPIGGVDWYPTLNTADSDATDMDMDSDANDDPASPDYLRSHLITVVSNEMDEMIRIDAGFWFPAKIGNMVFCDRNGNGINEPGAAFPEMGVDGVSVTLLIAGGPNDGNIADDADGNPQMETTAGGGLYEFDLVPPGNYKVLFEFNGTITDPPYQFTVLDATGSTDDNDSDVNNDPASPKYGETAEFNVFSQDTEEEMKWDAGVYRLVDIIGTIWYDMGMDGVNTGETGPGGVPMILTEVNGVYPPVNITSTTDGVYEAIGIPPGEYTLTITAAAFASGGSLVGAVSCSGVNDANDMADNDDNGPDTDPGAVVTTQFTVTSNCDAGPVPMIEYIDFCFEFDCGMLNPISAESCDGIDPINTICDVVTLDNFCNLMPTATSGGNQPTPLCPSGGGAHNMSWFAFVAYDGDYGVTVTPQNCTNSGGYMGVQIGLYTDCTFSETVYCNPNCSEDPVTFQSDGSGTGQDGPLIAGQTYYFFIDGCAGSVCSYDVEITGNPIVPMITPIDMCILDDTGTPDCALNDVIVCPGADVSFQVQGVDLTVDYTWAVNTVSGTPYSGDIQPMSTDENLILTFDDVGEYEVCITQIDNGCSQSQWNGSICRTIEVQIIQNEEFDDQTICLEDLGSFSFDVFDSDDPNGDGDLGWIATGTTPAFGTVMGTVTRPDGCMYEQEFELLQHPVSDVGLVDSIICRSDLNITIDEITYTENSFFGSLTFSSGPIQASVPDVNGCDSILEVNLEILDVFNGLFDDPPICTPDGVILNLQYDSSLSTDESFITWEWTDPDGFVITDNDLTEPKDILIPFGMMSGDYTLTAIIEKGGTTCTIPHTYNLNFDAIAPSLPTITGSPIMICESDSIQTYTASDVGSDVNLYNWDVTGGATIVSGGGIVDDMIVINWANTTGGSITLTVEGCGESDLATYDVSLVPILTPDFTVTQTVCQDSSSVIMFSGPTADIDSYTWDFDGGNILVGGTGPGPHEISWSDIGDHMVTLTVMHNGGCVSTETIQIINTIAPTPVTLNPCTSSSGQVVFTWDLAPGTVESDYSVVVTTGQTGTLSGTSFTIDGLGANEVVDISLTLLSGDACVSTTVLGSCVAQDCVPPDVSITQLASDMFCLNGTDQSFDLSAEVPPGVPGSGEFSGVGITDIVAGTFDPDTAGPGTHIISYIYQTDDGCTALSAPLTLIVNESPFAQFSTVDTICILEAFDIVYEGTSGSLTTYTTDDGQIENGLEPSISFTTAGEHTITLSVEKDGCPSLVPFSKTVFVQPELEQIVISCLDQDLNFVEFSWNSIDGATGYEVIVTDENGVVESPFTTTNTTFLRNGLTPGDIIMITVTVLTDNRCGGNSDSQPCEANACPTFAFSYNNPVINECVDGSNAPIPLQALASGGDGSGIYTWTGSPNVSGDQFDPNGLPEGQYELFVTYNENGCEGNGSVVVNITLDPTASFDITPDPVCIDSTVQITFTGSNLPGQVLDWSASDLAVTGSSPDYTASFTADGTFDFVLNMTNGVCTTTPATESITVEPALVFGPIDCDPDSEEITFSWAAVDCASEYEVFIDGVSEGVQTNTDFTATGLTNGQEVEIEVIAVSGCACANVMNTMMCEANPCITVTVDVSAMGGTTDFCFSPDLATVDVLAELTDDTGDGTGTYSGTGVDPVSGTFNPITAGVGSHTIIYTLVEPDGCNEFVDSVTFNIFENPEVTVTLDPIDCYEDSLTMLTIVATNGDGNYSITSEGLDVPMMSEVMAGTYDILVTDGNGCTAEASESVSIPAEPMPTITGAESLILGDSSTYSIEQSIFTGLAIDSIVWTANGGVICNDPACFELANQMPAENTTYDVTVFYNNGCSVMTSYDVEVTEEEPIYTVDIPNIISPNGDGVNDTWSIFTGDPEVIVSSVRIMDRWGNLVYENAVPYSPATPASADIGWNGKFGTTTLQPGVFVYTVVYVQDGRERVRNGDVTIVDAR